MLLQNAKLYGSAEIKLQLVFIKFLPKIEKFQRSWDHYILHSISIKSTNLNNFKIYIFLICSKNFPLCKLDTPTIKTFIDFFLAFFKDVFVKRLFYHSTMIEIMHIEKKLN